MPSQNNCTVFRGVALTFNAAPVAAEDITGWNLQMEIGPAGKVQFPPFTPLLILDNSSIGGISITNGPSGLFTITITSAQSLALGVGGFPFNVWRTDAGHEDLIAYGTLLIQAVVRW